MALAKLADSGSRWALCLLPTMTQGMGFLEHVGHGKESGLPVFPAGNCSGTVNCSPPTISYQRNLGARPVLHHGVTSLEGMALFS